MKIPYTQFELVIALSEIENLLENEEFKKRMEDISARFKEKVPTEQSSINTLVAQQNGISIEALINSPNLALLQRQYIESLYASFIWELQTEANLTEVQAYAILAGAAGLLNSLL